MPSFGLMKTSLSSKCEESSSWGKVGPDKRLFQLPILTETSLNGSNREILCGASLAEFIRGQCSHLEWNVSLVGHKGGECKFAAAGPSNRGDDFCQRSQTSSLNESNHYNCFRDFHLERWYSNWQAKEASHVLIGLPEKRFVDVQ